MIRVKTGLLVSTVLLSWFSGGQAVAAIGDTQTFGDGGTPVIGDGSTGGCVACLANGWFFAQGGVALDEGEDGPGDHALLYNTAGISPDGIGVHVLTWEDFPTADTNFLGDYLEAGVVAVRFRARHSGIGDSLVLRAYLFDTFGDGVDWAISNGSVTIANTGTGTSWQTYTISLRASDMESGAFVGPPPTVGEILSGVAQFGLRHDPNFTGPGEPARLIVAAYFDDIELILDSDGDGVVGDDDFCADTDIPEAAPTVTLLPNHWALTDDGDPFDFDTVINGKGPNRSYTVEDTAGCSCEQIVEIQGLGDGHTKYGCSIGAMDDWVDVVNIP